jgi:hypothetical protein
MRLAVVVAAGRTRIALDVLPDGSPAFTLWGAAGRPRTVFTLLSDGSPVFTLQDAAWRVLFQAP